MRAANRPANLYYEGSAMQSDFLDRPEILMTDDQELQVEWDKWRNKFLWAVQSGVQEGSQQPR